jgi:hypothetical protein
MILTTTYRPRNTKQLGLVTLMVSYNKWCPIIVVCHHPFDNSVRKHENNSLFVTLGVSLLFNTWLLFHP